MKIRLMTGLVTLIVFASFANAGTTACRDIFQAERVSIENRKIEDNDFNISRGLNAYSKHFPFKKTLEQVIRSLAPRSHWVDMGAGKARAVVEGLAANPLITATAISYKRPFDSYSEEQAPGRFEYLDGDFVENMWSGGRLDPLAGRVQLITDLYGPVSYSADFPKLLQVYMDLLTKGGEAYLNIMVERQSPHRKREFVNPVNGQKHGLVEWLKTIEGIEVEVVSFQWRGPGAREVADAVRIVKTSDRVVIPNSISTESYRADAPPRRVFTSDVVQIKNAEPFPGLRVFMNKMFGR